MLTTAACAQLSDSVLRQIEGQHLSSAIEALVSVCESDFAVAGTAWTCRSGPYGVLATVMHVRHLLDELESVVREQINRLDTTAPIGQRPPTAAEVAWAPPGTSWTFPYPDGSGHVTIANGDDGSWSSFITIYPQQQPGLCATLPAPPVVSVPCEAERILEARSGRPVDRPPTDADGQRARPTVSGQ